jgi:hypothetical protein
VDWAGDIIGIFTACGVVLSGVGTMSTRQKASEIHKAVQTGNGETLGQRIDGMADLSSASEERRIEELPYGAGGHRAAP